MIYLRVYKTTYNSIRMNKLDINEYASEISESIYD